MRQVSAKSHLCITNLEIDWSPEFLEFLLGCLYHEGQVAVKKIIKINNINEFVVFKAPVKQTFLTTGGQIEIFSQQYRRTCCDDYALLS